MLQKEIVQKRNNELINHCVVCRFPIKKKEITERKRLTVVMESKAEVEHKCRKVGEMLMVQLS